MSGRGFIERVFDWLDGRQPDEAVTYRAEPEAGVPLPAPAPRTVEVAAEAPLDLVQTAIIRGVGGASTRQVTEAFNASQPVGDRYELSGRLPELNRLVKSVIDGWHHAVIFGPRGVGKTSLARVFGDLTDEAGCDVFYQSASGDAEFEDLVRPYIRFIADSAGRTGGRPVLDRDRFNARDVADALAAVGQRRVFLIVDEFDRITNGRTRAELAALLKLLSDFRVGVQFVIVGISTDVDTLVQEHPSLRRHMVAVRVGPIERAAIAQLLDEGARRAGVQFEPAAADAIATVSMGSPYHARILALESALDATGAGRTLIDEAALRAGAESAWTDWAGVSPAAARLFTRVAARPELGDALAAIAWVAGGDYAFSERRIAEALSDLGHADADAQARAGVEALSEQLREVEGSVVFRDSLAPQFLLLALLRRGNSRDGVDLGRAAAVFQEMGDRLERVGSGVVAGEAV